MADNYKDAANLVGVIQEIVSNRLESLDRTATCQIQSVNEDGTLNVYLLPDTQTLIKNIINESKYDFNNGDYAQLYMVGGRVSNSFIICKYNPKKIIENKIQSINSINNIKPDNNGNINIEYIRKSRVNGNTLELIKQDGKIESYTPSTMQSVSFEDIQGDPYDNTALGAALDDKADDDNVIHISGNDVITAGKQLSTPAGSTTKNIDFNTKSEDFITVYKSSTPNTNSIMANGYFWDQQIQGNEIAWANFSPDTIYYGRDENTEKQDTIFAVSAKLPDDKTGAQTFAMVSDLNNYVTLDGTQTITGVKTFTQESQFTNSSYCPTWADIASGIGKSSCFTRGAFMQAITGQILLPNTAHSDAGKGYNTEANVLKVQKMTTSATVGQPAVSDFVVFDGNSAGNMTKKVTVDGALKIAGRYYGTGDDEGLIIGRAANNYAGVILGDPSGRRVVLYLKSDNTGCIRYNNGSTSYDITIPSKTGTMAVTSDILPAGWSHSTDSSHNLIFTYTE